MIALKFAGLCLFLAFSIFMVRDVDAECDLAKKTDCMSKTHDASMMKDKKESAMEMTCSLNRKIYECIGKLKGCGDDAMQTTIDEINKTNKCDPKVTLGATEIAHKTVLIVAGVIISVALATFM